MKEIDFEVTLENTEDDVKQLYKLLRPETKDDEIEYNCFQEGVNNLLVKLDDKKNRSPIVVRTYDLKSISKKQSDIKFDVSTLLVRKLEIEALKKASELEITIKLIATYNNGFIYEFIEGETVDKYGYDQAIAKKTAIRLARFHKIKISDDLVAKRPKILEKSPTQQLHEIIDKKMKESEHKEFNSFLPIYTDIIKGN